MTLNELLNHRSYIENICQRENIKRLSVFGSVVRGEATNKSDIDFLVEFDGKQTLFQIISIKQELENYFKRKVDLVTKESLSKYFVEEVLKERKIIYEAKHN